MDEFSVIEPEFVGELNVTDWFRLGITVSYRLIRGLSLEGMENKDFEGANIGFNASFGFF